MKIELNKIPRNGLEINEEVILKKELYEKSAVLDIKELKVHGNINYDYETNLQFNLEVTGVFLLQDALTLEHVEYPFSCIIDEKVEDIPKNYADFYEKSKNTLDISGILWENIVLEIPISFSTKNLDDMICSGNGWELVQENSKKMDPRLAKLTELLDERED